MLVYARPNVSRRRQFWWEIKRIVIFFLILWLFVEFKSFFFAVAMIDSFVRWWWCVLQKASLRVNICMPRSPRPPTTISLLLCVCVSVRRLLINCINLAQWRVILAGHEKSMWKKRDPMQTEGNSSSSSFSFFYLFQSLICEQITSVAFFLLPRSLQQ